MNEMKKQTYIVQFIPKSENLVTMLELMPCLCLVFIAWERSEITCFAPVHWLTSKGILEVRLHLKFSEHFFKSHARSIWLTAGNNFQYGPLKMLVYAQEWEVSNSTKTIIISTLTKALTVSSICFFDQGKKGSEVWIHPLEISPSGWPMGRKFLHHV